MSLTLDQEKRVIGTLLQLSKAEHQKAVDYFQEYSVNPDIEVLLNALAHITNAEQLLTSFYRYGDDTSRILGGKIISAWDSIREAYHKIRSAFADYLNAAKKGII